MVSVNEKLQKTSIPGPKSGPSMLEKGIGFRVKDFGLRPDPKLLLLGPEQATWTH